MHTFYYSKNSDLIHVKSLLENGEVIAFPTETVYGLGALISQNKAIEDIYALKKRLESKALTVHAGSLESVNMVAKDIPEDFYLLARHFLPGPLTVILKKNEKISSLISPYETIGFRIPAHKTALSLLKMLKEPIVGTSANISSCKSPVCANEVLDTFNEKISCIIDGGRCKIGVASTVLSLVGEISILREGSITKEQIEKVLNKTVYLK